MMNGNNRILFKGIKHLLSINHKFTFYSIIETLSNVLISYIPLYLASLIIDAIVIYTKYNSNRKDSLNKIVFFVLITVFMVFALNLIERIAQRKKEIYQERFYLNENAIFAKKTMGMKFENVEKKSVGLLKSRIDTENQTGYNMTLLYSSSIMIFHSIIGIVISLIFVARLLTGQQMDLYWKLLFIFSFIVVIVVSSFCNARKNCLENKVMEEWAPLNQWNDFYGTYLNDYRSGKDIRMFEMENMIHKNISDVKDKYISIIKQANKEQYKYLLINGTFSIGLKIILYLYLVIACVYGEVTVGEIAVYISYVTLCIKDVVNLISGIQEMQNNMQYIERYFSYLLLEDENVGNEKLSPSTLEDDCIEFCNVSFHYPDSDEYVFRNLSVRINANEKVAIVGRNGSGKTTFIKLLCRLYVPTSGCILLNGRDIQDYDYADYINKISVVFQDFQLFSLPIAENIACEAEYDRLKVIKCLQKFDNGTGISEKLDKYAYKYIDDDGIDLSGGEAQKLALARALYKNGEIMILDEPTSAMDAIAEENVFSKFKDISRSKTVIFSSHRLSACKICDRIFVFDDKNICQIGTHEELLKDKDGLYNKMWIAQTHNYVLSNQTST